MDLNGSMGVGVRQKCMEICRIKMRELYTKYVGNYMEICTNQKGTQFHHKKNSLCFFGPELIRPMAGYAQPELNRPVPELMRPNLSLCGSERAYAAKSNRLHTLRT